MSSTEALYLARRGMEIPSRCEHDPAARDNDGMTVAMYLARSGKEIPTRWKHDPILRDNSGRTVAMYTTYHKIYTSTQW